MPAIRPEDLPAAATVTPGAAIMIDNGTIVEKATPGQIVDTAAPVASQAEAEAGTDNSKRVTPLRVTQYIANQLGGASLGPTMASKASSADLASSDPAKGASLVSFRNTGTGPVIRSLAARGQLEVWGSDYGTIGDGINSRDTLLRAADALQAGGRVRLSPREVALIDTDLDLPPNVWIEGDWSFRGMRLNNDSADWNNLGGRLILNASKTFKAGGSGGYRGLIVHPKGMNFPQTNASGFDGIALTQDGDDAGIDSCMLLGFLYGMKAFQKQRGIFTNNFFDCVNGVHIEQCYDNPQIRFNHGWPFATIGAVTKPANWAERAGVGYSFKDTADWLTSWGNFTYAYLVGHRIESCSSFSLMAPSHDSTQAFANSIGIDVLGECKGGQVFSPKVAAQILAGIRMNINAGCHLNIVGGEMWANANNCIIVDGGDLHVSGGTSFRQSAAGITCSNATSKIYGSPDLRWEAVSMPLNPLVANPNFFGFERGDFVGYPAGFEIGPAANLTTPLIISANPLMLYPGINNYAVGGTTSFGQIVGGTNGREIDLIFQGALTVQHTTGTPTSIFLENGANFAVTPGSTLTLKHRNGQWFEKARMQA